jgi:hypothetical protein
MINNICNVKNGYHTHLPTRVYNRVFANVLQVMFLKSMKRRIKEYYNKNNSVYYNVLMRTLWGAYHGWQMRI